MKSRNIFINIESGVHKKSNASFSAGLAFLCGGFLLGLTRTIEKKHKISWLDKIKGPHWLNPWILRISKIDDPFNRMREKEEDLSEIKSTFFVILIAYLSTQ